MRRAALIISIFAVLAVTATAGAVVAGFPDVPDDHVHANGIAWAAENGLMVGYDNGNFGPEDPVTRGQLSTIFLRYDERLDDSGSGGGTQGPRGPAGPPGAAGAPGTDAQVTAQVGIGVIPILDGLTVGGSIAADHNPLPGATLSLAAGDYLIQVYGAFQIPGNGAPVECDLFGAGVEVWPQLTFWMDQNANNIYDGGEGIISPNVLMPDCNERHANVSGEIVISPNATTTVGLVAFGYNSASSSAGTGIIQGGGGLIASPLGDLTLGGDAFPAFDEEGGP